MILGRNTLQWMGLINAIAGLAIIAGIEAQIVGAFVVVVGAAVALIANTSTTPVSDPRLPVGTAVNGGTETVVAK